MTDTPLFPDLPETLSPFARWKRDNNLSVWFTPNLHPDAEDEFSGDPIKAWTCCKLLEGDEIPDLDNATTGDTEEEACTNYCLKFNMVHWSVRP